MIGAQKIIEKKKEYLYPSAQQNHFYKEPPQIVKGDMQYLYDDKGKKYIDFFAGVSVMNCGHCNKEILDVTIEQMQTLQHTTIIYLTEQMVNLAQKLSEVLPGDLKRSFFCCTGSEANEGAMLLARLHTKKNEFIALEGGLHGRTYLTMSATGIPMWRADPDLSLAVHFAKNVYSEELSLEESARESLKSIEEIINNRGAHNIAALIIELVDAIELEINNILRVLTLYRSSSSSGFLYNPCIKAMIISKKRDAAADVPTILTSLEKHNAS